MSHLSQIQQEAGAKRSSSESAPKGIQQGIGGQRIHVGVPREPQKPTWASKKERGSMQREISIILESSDLTFAKTKKGALRRSRKLREEAE